MSHSKREAVADWLAAHPRISRARARHLTRHCPYLEALCAFMRDVARNAAVKDARLLMAEMMEGGGDATVADLKAGRVEDAIRRFNRLESQKAQEEPRGPFPITDVQSSWLRGLLKPMPEPRAWDYWNLQRIA